MRAVDEYEGLDTEVIRLAWCRATSVDPDGWTRSNRAHGQDVVTALSVQEALGGKLLIARLSGVARPHVWNQVGNDGVELDLTLSQYDSEAEIEEPVEEANRATLLDVREVREAYFTMSQRLQAATIINAMRATHL